MTKVVVGLILGLLCAVVVGLISAVVLGVSTLLSGVFRVSVFEASLVFMAAAVGVVWFLGQLPAIEDLAGADVAEEEPEDEQRGERAHVWLRPMPLLEVKPARKRRR